MTTLDETLKQFDGQATNLLSKVRATFGTSPTFVDDLVHLADSDNARVSSAATWLIKDVLTDRIRLTETQMQDLFGRLDGISDWQSRLHICQLFQYLVIPENLSDVCADWLTSHLRSDRAFLRAWAMDALQHLASRNSDVRERAAAALLAAENDPAASARVRARNWRQPAK